MAKCVVDVLVPVALDQAYSYRVPDGLALAPGDVVSVPLGNRTATAVVWAENPDPNPRLHNRMKDVEEKLDVPPLKPELRNFVDWMSGYTLAPRGMVLRMALRMGEASRARARAGRRAARRFRAQTDDPGAYPGAGAARRRARARQGRGCARSRRFRGRDRRACRRGDAGKPGAAAGAGGARARSRLLGTRLHAGAARGGRRLARQRGQEWLRRHAPRRRHRLRQDPGLFRGGGGDRPARQAGARPAARDRAHHAVSGPLRRAFRGAPGGVAFAAVAAPARAHLGRRRGRGSPRDRGRALGAVPALCGSRARHCG